MANTKKNESAEPAEITFSKNKLLTFKRYVHRVDLLGVLLESDKEYTTAEVDSILDNFMKGTVK